MNKITLAPNTNIGLWTVLEEVSPKRPSKKPRRMFLCECACGTRAEIQLNSLTEGRSRGCGVCRKKTKAITYRFPGSGGNARSCYSSYKSNANKRNLDFDLSYDDFLKLTQLNCDYCGASPSNVFNHIKKRGLRGNNAPREPYIYNGIDRIDNSLGYTLSNCVACCSMCNRAKGTHARETFLEWAARIVAKQTT